MARKYSNISRVMSLTVGASAVDTTITVDDASGLPVTFPYALAVGYEQPDLEIVLVTGAASNVLTVTRGQEDTPARPHSIGAPTVHVATALDYKNAADHIEATVNVHGVGATASVVGTNTVQTLTNKTMDGASNTFSNIPASAVVGTFDNMTVGQANAAAPALTINANSTPTTNIITYPYGSRLDQNGVWMIRGKTGQTYIQRWEDSTGTVQHSHAANGDASHGRALSVGQNLTVGGTLGVTGTSTFSGDVTLSGAGTDLAVGGTLAVTGASTFSGDVTLSGAGTDLSVGGTLGVTGASTLASLVVSGTSNMQGAATFDSNIIKSGNNMYMLRSFSQATLGVDTTSSGASGGILLTTNLTVPTGRTGFALVIGTLAIDGNTANRLIQGRLDVDGVTQGYHWPAAVLVANSSTTTYTGVWVISNLAAGSRSLQFGWLNPTNTGTITMRANDTAMTTLFFY